MTRPTARVLALLEILQRGGTRTASDLAAQLGVDERTVRRYVGHLLDLDVPVDTVRGRYGGFRLAPGFRMPPVMLTDEEALQVLLGLLAAERAGLVAPTGTAAAKVRRVLPRTLAARLDALLASLEVTLPARPAITPEARVLLSLAEAARERTPVAITYATRSQASILHPYGIVAHAGRWYVTGADSASAALRTFRLDRITSVAARPGTFTVPAGFDPAARVREGIAQAPWRYAVCVVLAADPDEVRRRLPIATVEPAADGRVRARFRAERLDWVPGALAALNRPFTIESPQELRAEVRAFAARLHAAAGPDGT